MKHALRVFAAGIILVVAFVSAGALGVRSDRSETAPAPNPAANPAIVGSAIRSSQGKPAASTSSLIIQLETRVEELPGDYLSWATLGIAYTEQARLTADTSYYPRADAALKRSLEVNDVDNFTAYYGLSALAAARHDFVLAESYASTGLAINASSGPLHGILSDAQIQQGRYDEGFASAQRSVDLAPGVASFARVSYTYELTGQIEQATSLMQRALDDATTGADRAFALFHLGELALGQGDPNTALGYFLEALDADPDNISALSGKAHALRVSGQKLTSVDTYKKLVAITPSADFLIEFGDFLANEGRDGEAQELYDRAREQIATDVTNGAKNDAGIIIFEADHGDPKKALLDAEAAVKERPFLEMHGAHAWALYVNGDYPAAVLAIELAQQLGLRDAALSVRSAQIREAAGDRQGALGDLRVALEIDPHVQIPPTMQALTEPAAPS